MTTIPYNVVRRAKKWKDALRTGLSQPKVEADASRVFRAKEPVIAGMKPFGRTYASVLFRMVGTRSRRLRLLPIRAAASVTLLQVRADLPADLVALLPNKTELRAWARDPAVEWKLAECLSADPQSPDDCWSEKSCSAVRTLIASSTSDNELVWRTLITSDQAIGGAEGVTIWPLGFRPEQADPDVRRHRLMIALGLAFPKSLMTLHHIEAAEQPPTLNPPYGEEPIRDVPRPERDPAVPRRRSVLFVNPSYYNFHFLAGSLRKRGWDAVSMAIIDPNSDYAQHFHGHDWNLFEADANKQQQVLRERFQEAAERFDMFHFAGVGTLSFFPYNYDDISKNHDSIPWDVLELKRRGAKIGYSITGCHDLITQTGFESWSPGMCPKCAWRERPEICSDHRMSAWGWKVRQLADLICIETDPPLDFRDAATVFREPLTFAIDSEFWRPELGRTIPVPDLLREAKADGEILIYHSVGNYEMRTRQGVNVKGTGAVIAAIDRLKAEGHPVRLLFRKDVPSVDNRWMLAQADIIVDQLNYGRYGATAREGMMLGRPVVGRVNKVEARGLPAAQAIAECPIVDASEETIYEVLRDLVTDPDERARIGSTSRAHAERWWSRDVLAERYERVYDHLHRHGRPPETLE